MSSSSEAPTPNAQTTIAATSDDAGGTVYSVPNIGATQVPPQSLAMDLAMYQLHRAITQKDEQIGKLTEDLKQLQAQIVALRAERDTYRNRCRRHTKETLASPVDNNYPWG